MRNQPVTNRLIWQAAEICQAGPQRIVIKSISCTFRLERQTANLKNRKLNFSRAEVIDIPEKPEVEG